jgi:hypothetical protein
MNNKQFSIKLDTGIDTSGAIFSRVYNLNVLVETDDYSIIDFDCYNLVPSGFINGNTRKDLAMNLKVKFKDDNMNKNIAKLAIKLDKSLYETTGFKDLNRSRSIILQKLKEFEKTKDKIMVI